MTLETADSVKYLGIDISRKGVAKMYGARVERFIPRDDLSGLCLKRGFPGERRWLQLAFGLIFLGAAAIQIFDLLFWLLGGGTRYTTNILVLFILVGIGGCTVWDAAHSQWYLEAATTDKTFKLALEHKIDDSLLNLFVQSARQMGYAVDISKYQAWLQNKG